MREQNGDGPAQRFRDQDHHHAGEAERGKPQVALAQQSPQAQVWKRAESPDGFLIRRQVAQQASEDAHGRKEHHRHPFAMNHRRNGDQHAREQARHVAAEHAHDQAALEAEVESLVRLWIQHPRGDAGAEDDRAYNRHLHALDQRPLFPQQHSLKASAARKYAGERCRNRQLHQQNHQVLFYHSPRGQHEPLPIIIMKLLLFFGHSRISCLLRSIYARSPRPISPRGSASSGSTVLKGTSKGLKAQSQVVEEAVVLKMGDLNGEPPPLVRIHSQCLTGDVFHSLRCDCRAQLELALDSIAREGRGLLIYESQEGRGIGLLNKLRAYELQDQGADTVEANEQLGFEADLRGYALPAAIVRFFGLRAVRFMSNNPDKIEALERGGVHVSERVPCLVATSESTEDYMRTKKEKLGHLLDPA